MILGIGVDLVSIPRIAGALARWGNRFAARVYTQEEIALCRRRAAPAAAFAMRFAAKEAFSKAMGLGMRQGLRWREIEVAHEPTGKPQLRLQGGSAALCRRLGAGNLHISLSDDGDYAVAMVIIERRPEELQGGEGAACSMQATS